jgi:DNA primase
MKALMLPPDIGELVIATDGDDAGRDAGDCLANRASALGWRVSLMPAPDGLDWNDVLQGGGAI